MSALQNGVTFRKLPAEQNQRMCGAACLSMVYHSLGKDVPQGEIWPSVSKRNHLGSLASTTYLMAQDALKRGFRSVVIQARHPLQALRHCRTFGLSAILNHRMRTGSGTGHYSVLVDIDAQAVVLQDSPFGPARRLSHRELLELWVPLSINSEISGNVLIVIAPDSGPTPADVLCPLCDYHISAEVKCPACQAAVALRPRVALGCVNNACRARTWDRICCTACDHLWDLSPSPTKPVGAVSAPTGANLPKMLAALDEFTALIAAIPAAANHPDVIKQLEFIASSKEKLKTAVARDLAHRELVLGQLAELKDSVEQKRDEQLRKIEEMKKPMPPLDGNELGWALLRNLGLSN